MRESAAGDATCSRSSWEARSAGGPLAWERISLSCSLARPLGRLARQARIRNLITAIVIDLGEIRDIHYGNLRILTQSRMQEEGRRKTMSTRGRLPRKWRDRRMSGGNGTLRKKTRVANQFQAGAAARMIRRPMEFALHHPDPPLANLGVDLGTKIVLIKFTVLFRLAVRAPTSLSSSVLSSVRLLPRRHSLHPLGRNI